VRRRIDEVMSTNVPRSPAAILKTAVSQCVRGKFGSLQFPIV